MNIKEIFEEITDKEDLKFEEMQEVSLDIMSEVTDSLQQFFSSCTPRKEKPADEIAAAATVKMTSLS